MSRKSRQVTKHIRYANKSTSNNMIQLKHSHFSLKFVDVGERLYEDGLSKRKKKDKSVVDREEERKNEINTW